MSNLLVATSNAIKTVLVCKNSEIRSIKLILNFL